MTNKNLLSPSPPIADLLCLWTALLYMWPDLQMMLQDRESAHLSQANLALQLRSVEVARVLNIQLPLSFQWKLSSAVSWAIQRHDLWKFIVRAYECKSSSSCPPSLLIEPFGSSKDVRK